MAIRYDKELQKEINRTIKNFNQKIARLEKEGRELLPEKVTKKEIISDVDTRYTLRKRLKELQRFSRRGVEEIITLGEGVKLTKYEYEEIKRSQKALKQSLTKKIKKYESEPIRVAGQKQDSTFAESGDKTYLNLVARRKALDKKLEKINQDKLEDLRGLIRKSKHTSYYYDNIFMINYLDSLTAIGKYYGYSKKKIKEIKEKLLTLKPKEFTELFNEDKLINAIMDYNTSPKSLKKKAGINLLAMKDDVIDLFDSLYEKIDIILEERK